MSTGRRINQLLRLGAEHSLYRETGDFYQVLNNFPGILIDNRGYIRFETRDELDNYEGITITHIIHIKTRNGIRDLPNYIPFTQQELNLLNEAPPINQPGRRQTMIDRIVRNSDRVNSVKRIRNNRCQICETRLEIGNNSFYSEVHHIQPLGHPHNGPDIIQNMICVCPNCHKKLDYGFSPIEIDNISNLRNHTIDRVYIDYHNRRIEN